MELLEFTSRIALAALLGTLIGFERELNQHPAGLRTNALVAVGAALFVSLTPFIGETQTPGRIASYIVSGVGFLGGGAILKEGATVRGLTTAAGLWCSAAVGTMVGVGYGLHAAIGAGFVLLVLHGMRPLSHWAENWGKENNTDPPPYRITVVCREDVHTAIRAVLAQHLAGVAGITLTSVNTNRLKGRKRVVIRADLTALAGDNVIQEAVARLLIEPGVRSANWERLSESRGEANGTPPV